MSMLMSLIFWRSVFFLLLHRHIFGNNVFFKGNIVGHNLHINSLQSNNFHLQRFINKVCFLLKSSFGTPPQVFLRMLV